MSETGLAPATLDLVWFRGDDAVRFLNDLISQEIANASPGTVVRSFLLEPRGKVEHLLWALRGDSEVGLLTHGGQGESLATTLSRYRIRVDVEIEQAAAPVWMVVGGDVVETGRWLHTDQGLRAGLPWRGPTLIAGTGQTPDVASLDDSQWAGLRVDAAEPWFGVDVDTSSIPQETGLVSEAVDFTKGCFLGQELVARIDSRGGTAPRALKRIHATGALRAGTKLLLDGSEVGVVTTAADEEGLALVKRQVSSGDELEVDGITVAVR